MKAIIYDFDGTIYDGDSSIDFLKFLINKRKIIIFRLPKMVIFFIAYKMKLITKEKLKSCFFQSVKYFSDIDEIIKEFWEKKENKIKLFFKNQKNYSNVIIASASPYFLLKPIAEEYKIKELFASPVDKKTGIFSGKNCHGKEKVRLIKKKYPNIIIEEMYTDDIKADFPLVNEAKRSFIVKGNDIVKYEKNN